MQISIGIIEIYDFTTMYVELTASAMERTNLLSTCVVFDDVNNAFLWPAPGACVRQTRSWPTVTAAVVVAAEPSVGARDYRRTRCRCAECRVRRRRAAVARGAQTAHDKFSRATRADANRTCTRRVYYFILTAAKAVFSLPLPTHLPRAIPLAP